MGGIRIGAVAIPRIDSPPFTAYQGPGNGDQSHQVWRWHATDPPGEATQYTDFSGFTVSDQCHNPVLSPDGTMILFESLSATTGYREVWVVDNIPFSTATQLVADGSNYVIHPSWGPDSNTFVYVHCAGGVLDDGTLYKDTVSAPGSPVSLKTTVANFAPWRPHFNFDGTRIAYIYADESVDGSNELRVMDADGTNDAAVYSTIFNYRFDQPAQHSWANTMNTLVFEDGSVAADAFVVDDDGTGLEQINVSGDAAGLPCRVSEFCWPSGDAYVIITTFNGSSWLPTRAELDGSDTTQFGVNGAANFNWFEAAIVFESRVWFIRGTSPGNGILTSMSLNGSNIVDRFNTSLGSGDQVDPFNNGDGFYYN
jgi:hypothetical protein